MNPDKISNQAHNPHDAASSRRRIETLMHRQLMRIAYTRSATIVVYEGTLWLTEANHPHDVMLAPHQQWTVTQVGPSAPVLIEAMSAYCRFEIVARQTQLDSAVQAVIDHAAAIGHQIAAMTQRLRLLFRAA